MNGWFYDTALKVCERSALGPLRDELLARAEGKVLEIGSGTGLNFSHYPSSVEVIALEPDESMRNRSVRRGNEGVSIRAGDAENLPYNDGEFDTVVSTLVFCSIENPVRAAREVFRVLKKGGRFLLLEHVKKETPLTGALQDALTPLWSKIAGGCHLNRKVSDWLPPGLVVEKREILWRGLGEMLVLKKS